MKNIINKNGGLLALIGGIVVVLIILSLLFRVF